MARLVVLSAPSLADGFRLSGVPTTEVRPGPAAVMALDRLVEQSDVGLVLVTAEVWASIDERMRGRLERLARPIVLSVPAGAPTDITTRRELIGEMLRRAIGYRIELGGGGPR